MRVIIASLKVRHEAIDAFEDMMATLMKHARADEPGTQLYQLCRDREPAGAYTLIEMYEDRAAIEAHLAAPWFMAALPDFEAALVEPPQLKFLRSVDI